jgi:hypothetical protein
MKLFTRKKRTPAQTLKLTLVSAVAVVVIHLALKHWMAASDVVSVLFARGGAAPRLDVVLALAFVLLRIFVFLILPGIVARDLVLAAIRINGRQG